MRKSSKTNMLKIMAVLAIIGIAGYLAYDNLLSISYPHKLCQWICSDSGATTQTYGEYPSSSCIGTWQQQWCKCCVTQGQACQDDMAPCLVTTTTTTPSTTTTICDDCNGDDDYILFFGAIGIAVVGGIIYIRRRKR